jgi:hypothetical protein
MCCAVGLPPEVQSPSLRQSHSLRDADDHTCRNDSPYIEKRSHYFDATLGRQFDAVAFWEDSSPVAPLDPGKGTLGGEAERHEVIKQPASFARVPSTHWQERDNYTVCCREDVSIK